MSVRVVVNCAMSADGKIALKTRRQTAISNDLDKRRVHQLRNRADAILVGVETVISDDPKLTVNGKYARRPRNPIRIVLDSDGRTPENARVLDGTSRTMVVTNDRCKKTFGNAETLRCGKEDVDLARLLKELEKIGVRMLLVEGGSRVIWSFLSSRLADEIDIFVGSMVIGGDEAPTPAGGAGAASEKEMVPLVLKSARALGDGILLRYEVVK